jgi:uncharacterized protein involved in exopolysaccharide biosynthesis
MKILDAGVEAAETGRERNQPADSSLSPGRRPDINAFDLMVAVAKYKKQVLVAGVSAGILVGVISLFLPNMYTGTTRILPPQQNQSLASAMMGQLGPLAGLAGHDLGLKNPNDLYVAMLESRSAADALVQRFDLRRQYRSRSAGKAREELARRTEILNGKDGIISVSYDDEDPRRAADISNAYVEELSRISRTLAVSEASQRRLFYEKQWQLAKEQLSDSEAALKATQEATGLIEPGAQSRAIIDSVASLRSQIALKEVELNTMSAFATGRNPDYVRTAREVAGLRGQWAELERDSGPQRKGDLQVATERVPQAGMEYIRAYREVKYHETIFELIAKQYEVAKMDEERDAAVIQVLDPAIPPERKSGPGRVGMALMGGWGTALAVMLLAILRELPLLSAEQHTKLQLVRRYLQQV